MATALAKGCTQTGLIAADRLLASDPWSEAREQFAAALPAAQVTEDNQQVLAKSDVVVLAVKPQKMAEVLSSITSAVTPQHLLVSIAAGAPIAKLARDLPPDTRLVRVMPNTPCLIAKGASCFSRGPTATEKDATLVRNLLESVGSAWEVEEQQLDAVTGLSGSGPAFVYRLIEALAQGGQEMGLPADLSLQLAAQTIHGAADMVLTTQLEPSVLRNQVTSPGGTTLAGLEVLEKLDGPAAFQEAVQAATRRSIQLGKQFTRPRVGDHLSYG